MLYVTVYNGYLSFLRKRPGGSESTSGCHSNVSVGTECQKTFNDISTRHAAGLYWVPGRAGIRGEKIAGKPATCGSIQKFVGPEPSLGVSRQNIKNKIKRWVDNQHLTMWRVPGGTQRQAQKLISGPSPTSKTRLLSLNRAQSRVVTGLLTGHNTLRRHFYFMGLFNNSTRRMCVTEEENSVHILCKCEALISLRHAYLSSFSLKPEDISNLSLGANWNFNKGAGLPFSIRLWDTKGLF